MKTITHIALLIFCFLFLFNTSHAQESWQPVATKSPAFPLSEDFGIAPFLRTNTAGQSTLYAPILQSPSINAVDQSTLPALTWDAVPTATSYQAQISTSPLFTSNVYTSTALTNTMASTPELNFDTDYYWRVRCSDGTLTTTWSVLRKFRTAALMPNDLPANGESDMMMQPALRWHGDLTVSKFRVQLSTDPEFGQSVIIDTTITARSIVPPRLQPATRYYWRVFSIVNDTSTLWHGVWSFTTQYAEKFPFSVNDTWFYSGVPYGSLTKRIVSIASDGMRVVQCTGRDKNGESTGHEYWFYRFGNFYISTQPELNSQEIICYISSLTKDSVSLPGSYAYTWKVQPVNMFGAIYTSQLSTCVVNMGRWGISTFKYRMTEQLGITEIYRNDFDFYIKSYSIVGVIKNGVLFGDSTSSILNTPEKISIPGTYQLHQNFPNPFNPSTTFTFSVPAEGFVSLKVYDVMGREAASIVEEKVSAGTHERKWNAFNLPSGLYYYRMMAGTFSETKRLILLK